MSRSGTLVRDGHVLARACRGGRRGGHPAYLVGHDRDEREGHQDDDEDVQQKGDARPARRARGWRTPRPPPARPPRPAAASARSGRRASAWARGGRRSRRPAPRPWPRWRRAACPGRRRPATARTVPAPMSARPSGATASSAGPRPGWRRRRRAPRTQQGAGDEAAASTGGPRGRTVASLGAWRRPLGYARGVSDGRPLRSRRSGPPGRSGEGPTRRRG